MEKEKSPLVVTGTSSREGGFALSPYGKPTNKIMALCSDIKDPFEEGPFSGEGGIRTREPLRVTRAPGVRAKPDYATSPSLHRLG